MSIFIFDVFDYNWT